MGQYSVTKDLGYQIGRKHRAETAFREAKKIASNYLSILDNQVEHSIYTTTTLTLSLSQLADGGEIRLTAGQTSTLKITGLRDWHFLSANLTLKNASTRLALPLVDDFELRDGAWVRVSTYDPPIHARKLLTEGSNEYTVALTTVTEAEKPKPRSTGNNTIWAHTRWIDDKVKQIETEIKVNPRTNYRAALIADNLPQGISVSSAQDQIIHRVPQELAKGKTAQTPDFADILNAANGADDITLNLLSQTDGVVEITGVTSRVKQAAGQTPDAADHALSPWTPLTLTPNSAGQNQPQSTRLALTVRATGDAHLGLTSPAPVHFGIRPNPQLALAQPFQPCAVEHDGPITITGAWLFLAAPPETDAPITLSLNTWDSDGNVMGDERAKTNATISAALMDHSTGPDGMIAAWVQLTEPWVLDTPDQTLLHCLTLSEMDAPLRLIETPRSHAQLLPLLSQNTRRDVTWSQRDFAAPDKALAFELGYSTDAEARGVLTVHHSGGTTSHPITGAETDITFDLPYGPITLQSDVAADITNLSSTTQTTPIT